MPAQRFEVFIFAWIPQSPAGRFVPAGILRLNETVGANPANRELTSSFSYGTAYLDRPTAIEVDPVSLSLASRQALKGQELFPVNGLGEFGGIRDAAPDAWGRRVIEARRKVPANTLPEAEYLLEAGGDRVGALDARRSRSSPDSSSASDMHSLGYVLQAAEAVEHGVRVPANLEAFLGSAPSAGGARPKASVRDEQGSLWLAKFPARGDAFDVARAETCTLELARLCGLSVPETRYLDIGNKPVMLVRRFDRYWAQGGQFPPRGTALHDSRPQAGWAEGRLPFASGLTLVACSEWESRAKGYRELAAAVRKHVHPQAIKPACEELFARMVFNIFVSNDDDHLRNHAFLFDPRLPGWVLSPLYDVVPRPGIAFERSLHLEVGASGKAATLDNALSFWPAYTSARSEAVAIVRRVWGEVRQWKAVFEAHGAPGVLIDQLESAFRRLEHVATPALAAEIRRGAGGRGPELSLPV